MDNKEKILKILKSKGHVLSADLVKELKISRQKVAKHLSQLVKMGLLEKEGSTRNAKYSTNKYRNPAPSSTDMAIRLLKNIKDLQEDKVYAEVELRLGLKKFPLNVQNILFYAFGEMLNNAIDHSQAKKADIHVSKDSRFFKFTIKDSGIGVFANVQKNFKLENEFQALEHVLKGKQTTFPEQHSGQGIFFTSKIADTFTIRSHKIEVTNENLTDDLRVKEIKYLNGTEVSFEISRRSRKILRDLFHQYANEEFEFDRTTVKIKLTAERELLARSQAKRILAGLEKYKIVILDFKSVKEIGQAFVDEIFRVYHQRTPEVQIQYINANPAVEFMILRCLRTNSKN